MLFRVQFLAQCAGLLRLTSHFVKPKEPFARLDDSCLSCNLPQEITIPKDHYYMMGDNRGASADSREWGPVPEKWMIGQAFVTYWPPKRIGTL